MVATSPINHYARMQINDRVEDRTLYSGAGRIAYLKGNEAYVRFDDGSEEAVALDQFIPHDQRSWTI